MSAAPLQYFYLQKCCVLEIRIVALLNGCALGICMFSHVYIHFSFVFCSVRGCSFSWLCKQSLPLRFIAVQMIWSLCLLFRWSLCWWQQTAVKWSILLSHHSLNWYSVNWYLAPPYSMAAWMSVLLIARPPPLSPRLTPTSLNWLMNSRMRWRTLMMRPLWMILAPTLELRRDQTSSMMGATRFTTDPPGSF